MAASGPSKEFLISSTLIPDIFIARYMHSLGKDAIVLYLWTCMTMKGGAFTTSDAVSYGGIPEEDVKTALAELVAAGVLIRKEDGVFEPVDLIRAEVDEYIGNRTDENGVPELRSDEKKRNLLATSIQKTYYQGYMAYPFYRLIDTCLYDYHFEDDVVYALFEEGKELRCQYVVTKMCDLAKKWYEKGFTTTDALKDYYELRDRRKNITAMVGKMLRKHLTELDYERINRWVEVYGADEEIVEYAIRENEWRTTLRPVDVENKLKEWFDAGVMTIDKAMVYENERHKENKAAATKRKGRTNVRRSGKEAGITVEEPEKNEDGQAPENGAEEAPMHDSILDMFQGDDDEDN